MSSLISALRVPALKKPAKAALIFVHGLGDSGEGWAWLPQLIKQSNIVKDHDSINYVFPNAPQIPISVNRGYVMPAWFDIYEFGNPNAKQDEAGFLKSCNVLRDFIKEQIEKYNIPAEKIIIGGFSQGAAVSLATVATLDFKIGGVVALSGFCPIKDSIQKLNKNNNINHNTPIFQGHGTSDPVIMYEYGLKTSEFYKEIGFDKLQFHTYAGVAHSTNEEELADLTKFINSILTD
ncbi:Phospholipase/carboxylesterase/thioesterase [Scheffersomyces xylosifermentans]|uniref:Phospholipase/carboxylesterase/thioesterase n=1 Tax=Scheffersomyces xylosifermentans TaxID=1304137 RepID=UPI00315DC094